MTNYVQYRESPDTTTGSSPIIWADCPVAELEGGKGLHYFEDFVSGGAIAVASGPVGAFLDAGSTLTFANEQNGAVVLTEATDNEAVYVFGAPAFKVTAGGGKFWFEARIKTSTITTNEQAFFCGLMDSTAVSETVPLTAPGARADVNCVGFHKPEANTTAFDCSYKADGVTAVEVNSDVGTLAVDTYVKLGMRFDPKDNVLRFFINGVEQTSTKTIPADTGTDFPADVAMKFVVGQLLANSAAETITMDWIRVAQERAS